MLRASVGALPRVARTETLAPRTEGARHVVLDGDRFVFTARGHLMVEPCAGGEAQMLESGSVDAIWGPLVAAHGVVIGQRIDARAVPPRPRSVEVVGGPSVKAQTFGVAARAPVAVALDVHSGDVHVIDLAARTTRVALTLETRQAPELAGVVSVSDDGTHAWVTLGSAAHEDMWLVQLDLRSDRALAVHAPVTRGSVTGTRWGRHLVILEQLLGDEPRLRVLLDRRVLIARDGLHPLTPPVALSDTHLLLLAVPKPDPVTRSGEPQLCVLDVHGTLSALAPATGARVRLVDGAALVEDGRAVTRVTFAT